ncbi:MAG: hypothetical protein ACRC8S_17640 [Fimbriiglobus sp.]
MTEIVLGIDYGAPIRAGEQARKNIVLEAVRTGERSYRLGATGRNRRLVAPETQDGWRATRHGWTIPELLDSLIHDKTVSVAAWDFPFSIPLQLLNDHDFASVAEEPVFGSREAFVRFVVERLTLEFDGPSATAVMAGLRKFDFWKEPRFWVHRATDAELRGAPPLKNVPPNVFNMTLTGTVLVERLLREGYRHALAVGFDGQPTLVETYYAGAARRMGITRKTPVTDYLGHVRRYLRSHRVVLQINRKIQAFLEGYRTSGDDPDGIDALMCLVTAIAFREGFAEAITGGADEATIREEGVVILPI